MLVKLLLYVLTLSFAEHLPSWKERGINDPILLEERAFEKNRVKQDSIANLLEKIHTPGTYNIHLNDDIDTEEVLAMGTHLADVIHKLTDKELTQLKEAIVDKTTEPARRRVAYGSLMVSHPSLAKDVISELEKREEPLEKFLVLDLKKEDTDFDKSSYFDLFAANDPIINQLIVNRTFEPTPNHLLNKWLKRDFKSFVKVMSDLEKDGLATGDALLYYLGEKESQKNIQEEFKNTPEFYDRLIDLLLKEELQPKLRNKLVEIAEQGYSEDALKSLIKKMNVELPHEVKDMDWGRKRQYEMAEILKSYLKKAPESLRQSIKEEINKIILDTNPNLDVARTAVRKTLPAKEKLIIEKEVAVRSIDPSNTDPCAVKCRVAKHYADNWKNLKFSADSYYGNESEHPWKLAVKAKAVEFLYAVGDSCGKDLREKIKNELTSTYTPNLKSEDKIHVSFFQNETNPDLKAFLSNITEPVKGELPPHSPFIFAMSHLGQLLNRTNPALSSEQQNYLKAARSKVESWLSKVSQKAQVLSDGVAGGSVLGTYHYAALNLGYEQGSQPEELKNALEKMKVERKLSLEKYKSAQHIGYYMSFQKIPNVTEEAPMKMIGEDALAPSIRSASARMVPFNLVLYKNSTPEEKKQNADYLIESLHHYLLYFQDNWAGRGENRTHERYDTDMLAPYYGPATISYVYDAIAMLLKDKSLPKEKKKELEALSRDISAQLLSKFEKDGLLIKQNTALYAGAEDYENAFAGLALNDACRIKQEAAKNNAEFLPHSLHPGSSH